MKTIQSEIKENIQGTNSEGKVTRTQTKDLKQKEELNNEEATYQMQSKNHW